MLNYTKSTLVIFLMMILILGLSISGFAQDDPIKIGIVSISPSESNNARFINGVKEVANKYGWEVNVTDASGSADKANSAMQNMVIRGSDAIIDMVFPVSSLGTGLRAAANANIPVGTWGGGVGKAVVVTNGAGGPHAIPIVKRMVKDLNGTGNVLALTYHTGKVAREREQVLDRILKDYPEIKVTKNEVGIPGYFQDGRAYTDAWLSSHSKRDPGNLAIWGSWDDPALGAIAALKQRGRDDVLVYGENGNAQAILAVKNGWMTATAWQNSYKEGLKMAEVLKKAIEQDALAEGSDWETVHATVPPFVIDASNVEEFIKNHPDAVK